MNTEKSRSDKDEYQKIVVRYKLKADRVAENERLIKAVFQELHDRQPEGIRYTAYKLVDGVSFVHILIYETETAHKAFTGMPAFQDFPGQAKDRFEELPLSGNAQEIGGY